MHVHIVQLTCVHAGTQVSVTICPLIFISSHLTAAQLIWNAHMEFFHMHTAQAPSIFDSKRTHDILWNSWADLKCIGLAFKLDLILASIKYSKVLPCDSLF